MGLSMDRPAAYLWALGAIESYARLWNVHYCRP